ncbi:TetR/AcrR family transcriptional regulator [Actinospica durhamensis]|nr:TetR/AcrR family transcriptional regulator [Actinospica durhamensis]
MAAPETMSSLRERSKAKRRELIRRTAMRLFAERGYDHATIADIAAEAEVAPRTVTMYFSSKADVALSLANEVIGRLLAVFKEDPGLNFTDAVDRWLTSEREHLDPELAALNSAMFEANPDLRSLGSTELSEVVAFAGPAFKAEVGLPDGHPLRGVISAAAGAALTQYLFTSMHKAEQPQLHDEFMHVLRTLMRSARTDAAEPSELPA